MARPLCFAPSPNLSQWERRGSGSDNADSDEHALPHGLATAPVIDETSTLLAADVDAALR